MQTGKREAHLHGLNTLQVDRYTKSTKFTEINEECTISFALDYLVEASLWSYTIIIMDAFLIQTVEFHC